MANTPEARQADRQERHRAGFEDVVWFRMDIGRRQNADPRWVLPLLCRRGHITRNEVGAIRIGPDETHFQVPRAIADRFASAISRTAGSEDGGDVLIEPSPGTPRDAARQHRKSAGPRGRPAPKHAGAKPRSAGNEAQPRAQRADHPAGKKPWSKKPHRKGPRPG